MRFHFLGFGGVGFGAIKMFTLNFAPDFARFKVCLHVSSAHAPQRVSGAQLLHDVEELRARSSLCAEVAQSCLQP